MLEIVGKITDRVIELLEVEAPDDRTIYLGDSNIFHMETNHPYEYEKYGSKIEDIIDSPDYVGLHKNESIEYFKEYKTDTETVKLAIRISGSGMYFARTLYIVDDETVQRYIEKGTLKKYAIK